MTEIATIDWFGRSGTSVFSENTAICFVRFLCHQKDETWPITYTCANPMIFFHLKYLKCLMQYRNISIFLK